MRAFVALEISNPAVLDSMVVLQKRLEATGADLKVVERENLHFTVKFLGEITEDQGNVVGKRLRALTLNKGEVEVSGVGAFPSPSRPSVIWAGVSRESEQVVLDIAVPVIKALDDIGERDTRPYHPHATLARVRTRAPNQPLLALLKESSGTSFGTSPVSELKLKSSTLTPSGPIYKDIGAFSLP